MKIAISADHAGYPAKKTVVETLEKLGHQVFDFGTNGCDSVDFPDFAEKVADAVTCGKAARGILLCGSGIGMCIAANKFKGVRASIAHDVGSAAQGVNHNDMNVLCIGAKVVDNNLIPYIVESFLNAEFLEGEERFVRRVYKIQNIEEKNFK